MPKGRKPGTVSAKKNAQGNKFQPVANKKKLQKVVESPLKGLIKKKRGK